MRGDNKRGEPSSRGGARAHDCVYIRCRGIIVISYALWINFSIRTPMTLYVCICIMFVRKSGYIIHN